MIWTVYLSGEIHTDWREQIQAVDMLFLFVIGIAGIISRTQPAAPRLR